MFASWGTPNNQAECGEGGINRIKMKTLFRVGGISLGVLGGRGPGDRWLRVEADRRSGDRSAVISTGRGDPLNGGAGGGQAGSGEIKKAMFTNAHSAFRIPATLVESRYRDPPFPLFGETPL